MTVVHTQARTPVALPRPRSALGWQPVVFPQRRGCAVPPTSRGRRGRAQACDNVQQRGVL